jgi:hypothetical protein
LDLGRFHWESGHKAEHCRDSEELRIHHWWIGNYERAQLGVRKREKRGRMTTRSKERLERGIAVLMVFITVG